MLSGTVDDQYPTRVQFAVEPFKLSPSRGKEQLPLRSAMGRNKIFFKRIPDILPTSFFLRYSLPNGELPAH